MVRFACVYWQQLSVCVRLRIVFAVASSIAADCRQNFCESVVPVVSEFWPVAWQLIMGEGSFALISTF